jgi:murein L,D-transpeptidase YcbB/YkuD
MRPSPLQRLLGALTGLCWSIALAAQIAPEPLPESLPEPLTAPLPAHYTQLLRYRLQQEEAAQLPPLDWTQLTTLYAARDYLPAWLDADGPNTAAQQLLTALRRAGDDALEPASYHVAQLEQLWQARTVTSRIDLELLLSNAFFDYSRELRLGRLDPLWNEQLWYLEVTDPQSVALLQAALRSDDFALALRGLAPGHPAYRRLREALARYRQLQAAGGWPTIPPGPTLRPGELDPRIPLLRRRMQLEGELPFTPLDEPLRFDETLRFAVKRFQLRHGLKRDGVVGPLTLAELNVPLAQRITQITLNMERWRWLPDQLGQRHLIVNVSAYLLNVYDHGERQLTMPVITGTAERPTPLLSGKLHTITFNPYWTIPQKIAMEEVFPRQRRDPDYLGSRGIRVFTNDGAELSPADVDWSRLTRRNYPDSGGPYRLRQDPGPQNPLGRVKFTFSNNFQVYLHDTPDPSLFDEPDRAFSHGCIRVAQPLRLASYLLDGDSLPSWDEEAIRAQIASAKSREVALRTPLPLYLLYLTAWVGDDGAVHFRKDPYGEDAHLLHHLSGGELP